MAAGATVGIAPTAADVTLVNVERNSHGLGDLRPHPGLTALALEHSAAMAARGSTFHGDSLGAAVSSVLDDWTGVAENVGTGDSEKSLVAAFMASPRHRANILGDYTAVGVGLHRDAGDRLWMTQIFAKSGSVVVMARMGGTSESFAPPPPPPPPVTTAPPVPVTTAPPTPTSTAQPAPASASPPTAAVTPPPTGGGRTTMRRSRSSRAAAVAALSAAVSRAASTPPAPSSAGAASSVDEPPAVATAGLLPPGDGLITADLSSQPLPVPAVAPTATDVSAGDVNRAGSAGTSVRNAIVL